jgi:hypothetical protein
MTLPPKSTAAINGYCTQKWQLLIYVWLLISLYECLELFTSTIIRVCICCEFGVGA